MDGEGGRGAYVEDDTLFRTAVALHYAPPVTEGDVEFIDGLWESGGSAHH